MIEVTRDTEVTNEDEQFHQRYVERVFADDGRSDDCSGCGMLLSLHGAGAVHENCPFIRTEGMGV